MNRNTSLKHTIFARFCKGNIRKLVHVGTRIMGKGLNLPILLVFLPFLWRSWMFGFVGALLANPATLFVKALLQGRQETHFLVVLLSGKGEGTIVITIPQESWDEKNVVEEQSGAPNDSNETLKVDSTDASIDQE